MRTESVVPTAHRPSTAATASVASAASTGTATVASGGSEHIFSGRSHGGGHDSDSEHDVSVSHHVTPPIPRSRMVSDGQGRVYDFMTGTEMASHHAVTPARLLTSAHRTTVEQCSSPIKHSASAHAVVSPSRPVTSAASARSSPHGSKSVATATHLPLVRKPSLIQLREPLFDGSPPATPSHHTATSTTTASSASPHSQSQRTPSHRLALPSPLTTARKT